MKETKDKGHPPTIQDALKEALKRLPHDEQKRVREILKAKGVLKDDKAE
jgi:hypothetical protein